jgi:hypothetical protein
VLHLQTHFEAVVVHEDEEKCRDAIYSGAAGPAANKAVHTSGNNFSKGRNNTITASRWSMNRWGPGFFAVSRHTDLIAAHDDPYVPA